MPQATPFTANAEVSLSALNRLIKTLLQKHFLLYRAQKSRINVIVGSSDSSKFSVMGGALESNKSETQFQLCYLLTT